MQPTKYCKEIKVEPQDIDYNLHVNNLVYLKWAQGIGGEHWQAVTQGLGYEHYAWVVMQQEIEYLIELKEGDTVTIETYIDNVVKHKCVRIIQFYCKNKLVCKAKIVWVCIHKESKKPLRIDPEVVKLFLN